MPKKCSDFPRLVTKVLLKDVNFNSINMNVVNYLCSLRSSKTELIIKSITLEDDQVYVELKDTSNGCLVNQEIINRSEVKMPKLIEENRNDLIKNVPPLMSSIGSNKKLFCISKKYLKTEAVVLCLEEKFVKDFYQLQKALNEFGETLDPENYGLAQLNDMSIMKIKDQWYRGVVKSQFGDGYPLCFLLDISEQCKIPVESIFPLPKVFALNPIYCDFYMIDKYQTISDDKKEMINSCIQENNYFIADEIKEGVNDLIIEFQSLNEI